MLHLQRTMGLIRKRVKDCKVSPERSDRKTVDLRTGNTGEIKETCR